MYKIAICDDNLFFIKQLRIMLKEKIRSDDQIEIYCSGTIRPTTEAFQVQPYRYLLKQEMNQSWDRNIDDILHEMKLRNQKILKVTCEKEEKWIHSDNLLYVMTEGKHSKITFYENEEKQRKIKTITVRENIREIEEKMDQETCYRVHRSVIVQFNYIVQIKNNYNGRWSENTDFQNESKEIS